MTDSSGIGLADKNPLRYRGYVFDTETGFYYCQSRYYDPCLGRFINADGYVSTGQGFLGHNMFAYCGNNPVMYYDPSGFCKYSLIAIGGKADCGSSWCTTSSVSGKHHLFNWSKTVTLSQIIFKGSNITEDTPNRRPNTGEPGSTYTAPDGARRVYGPDGNPERDYDNPHSHDPEPHIHNWPEGIRGPRQPVPPTQAPTQSSNRNNDWGWLPWAAGGAIFVVWSAIYIGSAGMAPPPQLMPAW